jgi:hypothetical protein
LLFVDTPSPRLKYRLDPISERRGWMLFVPQSYSNFREVIERLAELLKSKPAKASFEFKQSSMLVEYRVDGEVTWK